MKKIDNFMETPLDIKFINGLSNALFFMGFIIITLCGFQYFLKNHAKNFMTLSIKGDILHSDASFIRNKMVPGVSGNFYTIDLNKTQTLFEAMPWVKQAVVKRVYPNRIELNLFEHKPRAIWGAREDMKLVDENGFIFEANSVDDEFDQMPQLIGPEGQGKYMLDMYKNIGTAMGPLKQKLKTLELNARGSWIATLESDAHIELGRGGAVEVMDRVSKFTAGVEQTLTRLNKKPTDILYVDLRHAEGYAIRMNGISTLDLTAGNASLQK
jgi:cell division protein FtsQ